MTFLKIIKGLLGRNEESLDQQEGFQFQPNSEGLIFYLHQKKFDALREGHGNTLQEIQLIALHMLEEQGLVKKLPNGFRMLSADLARLDDEQAEVLQLPGRFPGEFTSQIQGRTGQSGFRVNLSAKLKEGEAPFTRKGPFLNLSATEVYRLTPEELMGLEAWQRHQALEPEARNEASNLRLMAELQIAARRGMRIDLSHFDRMDVVIPENIGVTATRLPDGSLMLCPSLGDGSTPDQLEKRWSQLDMNAEDGVLRVNNRIVLLEAKKIAAIKEVLGNKRIPADKVADFIKTPSAFLDAALINLELGFSIRVMGIGKLQHMDFGELDSKKQDWFALDTHAAPAEMIAKLVQSPEDLEKFEQTLAAARAQNAESLLFAGEMIDISCREAVDQQVTSLREQFAKPADACSARDNTETSEDAEAKEQVTVLIREAERIDTSLLEKAAAAQPLYTPDWSAYARQPFPHQREGIEWMLGLIGSAIRENQDDLYRLQGGLLADDMGLGKTYMSLVTAAEYLALQEQAGRPQKPVLVVAPLSLLENWEDEVTQTFNAKPFSEKIVVLQSGRDLKEFRIEGAERESQQLASLVDSERLNEQTIRYALHVGPASGDRRLDMECRLVLTTYQTLRDYQFSLCQIDWGMVIFDEAQNIKNPNALQTRAAKGLKADFKLLATGTPVENSLGDFWCLMDTVQPGLLGDWPQFRDNWVKPILAANEEERDTVRERVGAELRKAVGCFMLRRVKEDQLKGLPSKTIHSGVSNIPRGPLVPAPHLAIRMTGLQLQAYDAVLNSYHSQRATEDMRGKALAALSKLREVSLHPRLHEEQSKLARNSATEARQLMQESGKLAVLLKLLDEIRQKGEKVILFMVTKRLQSLLSGWLKNIYGLDIAIINGDTAAVANQPETTTRKRLISAFEARSGFNVLIMSPVAAGVGLTVIGANHVVHLERHWNPAKEAQASDRVYRIGQNKPVHIYLPAVLHPQKDSFDQHLDRLLMSKLMLKDSVVTPETVSEGEMMASLGL